jgi:predicted dehydrogenase
MSLSKVTLINLGLTKFLRFMKIWGLRKTLFKVLGRRRSVLPSFVSIPAAKKRDIGIIGCGQFSFSTIGSVVTRKFSNRIVDAFDIDEKAKNEFSKFFSIKNPATTATDLISNQDVEYVYIVSNHASHTPYALEALATGKTVYVEKPLSVCKNQIRSIKQYLMQNTCKLYVGYNRPFSPALMLFKEHKNSIEGPFTINAFITGHKLSEDHWYRKEGEGNRVCGNLGHWIDLVVHLLHRGGLPDRWSINIVYSEQGVFDDNFSVSMTSTRGDLINFTISSRHEPFEGINETILIQNNLLIAHIYDFRRICIWVGESYHEKRFAKKDVGHDASILQPFGSTFTRDINEVLLSTYLMIHISQMVSEGEKVSEFSFEEASVDLESHYPPA